MSSGLTRRVGVVACGRAATTLSIFAVNAILTRAWLDVEGAFGIFTAVWLLGNTLAPIFSLGIPTGLLYFFGRRQQTEHWRLVLFAAAALFLSAIVLTGLLAAVGPVIASALDMQTGSSPVDLASYVWPFLPYVFCLVAGGYVESTLVAAGKQVQQALLALIWAAALVAAAAWAATVGLSVQEVLLAISAVGAARLVAGSALAIAVVVPSSSGQVPRQPLAELLIYSLPIGLNDTVGILSRSVDRFVILMFFSADTFGLYYVGAIEVPISLLLSSVVTVLIPEISRLHGRGDGDSVGLIWRQAVSRLSMLTSPLFFFLFAFAGQIIAIYLPPNYAEAEFVFRIFLLALPLRCAIYNPLLIGMGKARWALWAGIMDLGVNLLLSVILVFAALSHNLGLSLLEQRPFLGPAVATVAATYLHVGVLLLAIARQLRANPLRLLPLGRMLRFAVTSAVTAGISLAIAGLISGDAIAQLVVGFVTFFFLMLGAVRAVPSDREEVRQTIRSLLPGLTP